jgi:23S rRNA (adenine2030-N6)-methyltransferase
VGVGRLYREGTCTPYPLPEPAETLIAPWRKAIAAANDGQELARYPGSPEIARRLARDCDKLVFNELHAEDHAALAARFARERRAAVTRMDAWIAAKALTPPPERRGLVLMDPPYEAADEALRALTALREAYRRFATGVFCLWYPIKRQADANALANRAGALGLPKTARAEVIVRRADSGDRLNGSGLILVNPPWKLEQELGVLLPALTQRLAERADRFRGSWRSEWLVGEEPAAGRPPARGAPAGGGVGRQPKHSKEERSR